MNPQDILKQAANSLRQAAQARQQEVNDLQKNLDEAMKDQESQLNVIKQQMALRMGEAANAKDDMTTTTRKQQARLLQTQESDVKSSLDQTKKDTDQLIKVKRRNVDDINKLAQRVDQWAQM